MALASVADLKSFLSISHSGDDDLLTRLVAAASSYFEQQTGRTILATDYVVELDGDGRANIVPPEYPVISVTSLEINGITVPASTGYGVEGWFLRGNLITLRGVAVSSFGPIVAPMGYPSTQGVANVKLSYRAGFETVPEDIRQAVVEMAALMYREKERVGQQSHNNSSGSTVFYYAPPARVVATIEAYRRSL